ncbi:hypothetical protein G3N55_11270 [Dissulfurirhabdus thermomarina]|uniref:HTH luxR-type domain-containing protein n=1 Tax=Dissulfurirhabdus thermomarina TaxID=1765737 RepID=A0A6N9TQS6_DISTH|nr:LuxR family transcriptional regulator [Dissulfurirhabdus thermomarina]NDY43418.1 hypothetical protein [Dissulfurirhabdus thermomarina]NMX23530.1 hypothetical protein [Dissulfurirhabdus thermomarina]
MKIQHLSHRDAVLLLEMIDESLSCTTEEDLRRLVGRLSDLLPYQAALSCAAVLPPGKTAKALHPVNVDYPEPYLEVLQERGLVFHDPVLVENFRSFRLQYWADTIQRRPSPRMLEIASLAEDFGFHRTREGVGYAHGARDRGGRVGSFFCFHGLPRCPRTEEILSLVVPHLHEALRRAVGVPMRASPLTRRETEVLRWIKEGKGTWEISVILGISERTVKFHVGNILRKLDVETRAHAVARALEEGFLDLG